MVEICEKCKKEVKKNEEAIEIGDSKVFHLGCFRCDKCTSTFNNEPFVSIDGMMLHKHCFNCEGCGDSLAGQKYGEHNGQKMCSSCTSKRRQIEREAILPPPAAKSTPHHSTSTTKTTTTTAVPSTQSVVSSHPPSQASNAVVTDTDQLISCPICTKKIFPSEKSISIHTNKAFHLACIKCSLCGNIFEDGKLHQESGKYYHKHCLQELHTPKCDKCHKGLSSYVSFKNQKLHPECFSCSRCSKKIGTEGVGETPTGEFLCLSCQNQWKNEQKQPEQESKICHLCSKSVHDGMVLKGHVIHKECFRCGICDHVLKKEDVITEDRGFFLHVDCLKNEIEEKCDKCGKILNENYITLNGGNFHEECVTCTSCGCSLANSRFTEKDGGMFCKNCLPTHKVVDSDVKSGSTLNKPTQNSINVPDGCCPKCLKKVYMSDTVNGPRATTWHRACLACAVCRKPLDTYAVLLDGQVFCTSHGRRK